MGIRARTCSVGGVVDVTVLAGSDVAVLAGVGVSVNSGVAVTTTTTSSGSMQAATSIATNAATTIHGLFVTPSSASEVLGFVQFDGLRLVRVSAHVTALASAKVDIFRIEPCGPFQELGQRGPFL